MKQIAEYIVAMVFSVFFLIGGASFTLSHYCCNKCKTMHNAQCIIHYQSIANAVGYYILKWTLPRRHLHFACRTEPRTTCSDYSIHLLSTWYPPYFRLMRRATFTHRHWRQIQITPEVYCGVFAAGWFREPVCIFCAHTRCRREKYGFYSKQLLWNEFHLFYSYLLCVCAHTRT